jgi:aminoglycoside phosphotransferase (APT) family kinase protein
VDELVRNLGLTVVRQLAGGEWGAYLSRTSAGETVVLKVMPRHWLFGYERVATAVRLAATLRDEGYPIPRYLDVGTVGADVYTVQEAVAGSVPDALALAHVKRLIELWKRHEGGAVRAAQRELNWCERLEGERQAGKELLASGLRPELQPLAGRAMDLLSSADPAVLRSGDVVHGDFHHRNLLAVGSDVTAVFDWEGAGPGDSRHDLLRLASAAIAAGQVEPAGAALLRAEVERWVPVEVRAILGAIQVLDDFRFVMTVTARHADWTLRCAHFLLDGV